VKQIPIQRPASLRLSISAPIGKSFVPFLRKQIRAAHGLLGNQTQLAELSIALVGDREMSALHEQFMGIAGPTDVLTFPLEFDRWKRPTSGEVVVDVAEARRRARLERIPPRLEVLLYALHGLLHLSGYDDRTKSGFARMHRVEDDVLSRLGLEPVFERQAAGSGR
jgi:probable rRNA maturation factor